jgi:hypothetical protein
MAMSATLSEVSPSSDGRMTEWCYFVLDHLNEFAKLAWYLVADTQMVESVMLRAIVRLESTPYDAPDELVRYNQARDTLIAEAIAVLGLPESGNVEMTRPPTADVTLCELPHLPRLAFLLKLILRMPESEVAKLLSVPSASVIDLIQFAVLRLSYRPTAYAEAGLADA